MLVLLSSLLTSFDPLDIIFSQILSCQRFSKFSRCEWFQDLNFETQKHDYGCGPWSRAARQLRACPEVDRSLGLQARLKGGSFSRSVERTQSSVWAKIGGQKKGKSHGVSRSDEDPREWRVKDLFAISRISFKLPQNVREDQRCFSFGRSFEKRRKKTSVEVEIAIRVGSHRPTRSFLSTPHFSIKGLGFSFFDP